MITEALPIEVASAAALLGEAFALTPQSRWIVPDDTDRPRRLAVLFEPLVEHAVKHGRVDLILDQHVEIDAAAVWLPSDAPAPPEPGPGRWATFVAALAVRHPTEPHQHLALLGVHPRRQGCGFGSRLLEHGHRGLREPAYLEAETPRLVALYRRHGYWPGQAFFAPSGLPMWPMWRAVHGGAPG